MDTSDGLISGKISLMVRDLEHLDNLMTQLSVLKGIYRVSRMESS
jgi:(p)ppGpp synthase/HD superfamily hydrolase